MMCIKYADSDNSGQTLCGGSCSHAVCTCGHSGMLADDWSKGPTKSVTNSAVLLGCNLASAAAALCVSIGRT